MAFARVGTEFTRDETKRSLTLFNWSMSFRSVYDAVCATTGFIFVDFVLSLGVAKEQMGLFAALSYAACIFLALGLWALTRASDRKRFALGFAALEPALFLLAVVAALVLEGNLRLWVLLAFIFLGAGAANLIRPTTDEWLASSIPVKVRGRFLGKRVQIASLVSNLSVLSAGFVAGHFCHKIPWRLGLLMIVAGLFGFLAIQALRSIPLPAISAEGQIRWAEMAGLWHHRPFRRFLLGTVLYNLPFTIAVPFYQVFNLKVLGLNEAIIPFTLFGYWLMRIIVAPILGRWVDRFGPRLTALLISPGFLAFFALYAFSGPGRAWMVFLGWALAGIGDAGFGIASPAALYSAVPKTSRPAYFAAFNLVSMLPSAVGAATATLIAGWLKYASIDIGALHLEQFNLLFGIVSVMFVGCAFGVWFYPGKAEKGD